MTLARRTPGSYDKKDLVWAQDLAYRIGLSIENRRLLAEARELFEQSVSANFVSTPDGAILACNQKFVSLLGFTSIPEALATPISSLYDDPTARDRFLSQLREQKRVVGCELALCRRDGRVITVLADAIGEFDEAGVLVKKRGFLADRTAQNDLEGRLRQFQRLEAVGKFRGMIGNFADADDYGDANGDSILTKRCSLLGIELFELSIEPGVVGHGSPSADSTPKDPTRSESKSRRKS